MTQKVEIAQENQPSDFNKTNLSNSNYRKASEISSSSENSDNSDDHSGDDDDLKSPIMDSPILTHAQKRMADPIHIAEIPAKTARPSEMSNDKRSLCENLEDGIKVEISNAFKTLKEEIDSKETEIVRLKNDLKKSIEAVKLLQQEVADRNNLRDQNEELKREISDLKTKKEKCIACKKDLNQPTFCSNDCIQ